ncbi:TetR/AcrR family transcriptional regulator [Actinoalloteichus sp. AHMU CJ021]|uniref:Transcriptional regulator, TetR family n=1 Tax=Actinoalloteichus caeruleus DSM 43889 TaxID=1120930 RepID=A0ABT1JM54_ACTCY|nr:MULTISPECIES: TetR/AcrR family transcriptional regulator [Actinoalloteichus]AUS79331.1 TetR/AcrR family transcriptional regulator [Actinoalloteichus sp. AHMU CJ021]MCP2333610.1 transcriptional regulator, TetR family [Actinoalloteichus caeruleus DSM 43889]
MPRPRTHDDALRIRLLDRAGELLSAHGPEGLSLRRLANDVGTSTTAVYSLFGGKPELVQALLGEAFDRFAVWLAEVPSTDDPVEDLIQLGLAYRRSALADPHLYGVMFSQGTAPSPLGEDSRERGRRALRPLFEAVRRGLERGVLAEAPPETIVMGCWGQVHGLVSLELGHRVPPYLDVEASYERALRANARGWLR